MPYWTFYRRAHGAPSPDDTRAGWELVPQAFPGRAAIERLCPAARALEIRRCTLPFYVDPLYYYEAVAPGEGDVPPTYAVMHDADPTTAHSPARDAEIEQLNRRHRLALTEKNVVDYLYFRLSHRADDGGRDVPAERLEQIRWRSAPPGNAVRELVEMLLRPASVEYFRSSGSFEVQLSVVRGRNLYRARYSVNAHGRVTCESREPLLWSLPVVHDSLGDFATTRPSFPRCCGDDLVAPEEVPQLMAVIAAALPTSARLPDFLIRSRRSFLPGADLFQAIYVGAAGKPRRRERQPDTDVDPAGSGIFVLRGERTIQLFDGSAEPIHRTREIERFELCEPGMTTLSHERVVAFMALVCALLVRAPNSFAPMEEACDLLVTAPPAGRPRRSSRADGVYYDELTLPELNGVARPLEVVSADEREARITGCVQYTTGLYGALFTVYKDGSFLMANDLGAVRDLPTDWSLCTPPFRRDPRHVRSMLPSRQREVLAALASSNGSLTGGPASAGVDAGTGAPA